MGKSFRPYEPGQRLLLPPDMREWLPEGHLARCVSDVVEALDPSAIFAAYAVEERGQPPYHSGRMVKLTARPHGSNQLAPPPP
jgi:transposase